MSWTYSGDPRASALDEVRFRIGDTDQTQRWTLQDAEIQYAIGLYPKNKYLAMAVCAESILAKLKSTVADKKVGDLSITYNTSMLQEYQSRAYQLRQLANLAGVPVYAGGQSRAEKATEAADTDRVQPAATMEGMVLQGNTGGDPSVGS